MRVQLLLRLRLLEWLLEQLQQGSQLYLLLKRKLLLLRSRLLIRGRA